MNNGQRFLLEKEPVAQSSAMREALSAAKDVATTNTTVLLYGESGTGKEVLARYIHRESPRAHQPWVAVNCAALPSELLESELFGHEKGAFTGASERRVGKVELAHQGTLLLDEISELTLPLQAKLLRVLQERELDRVGGNRSIRVDVRVIATSNQNLARMVEQGRFRADLYYRLNVFPIELPALRNRPEDLEPLVTTLLEELSSHMGRSTPKMTLAAWEELRRHRFPGNVRELGNVLERAIVLARQGVIEPTHLGIARQNPVTQAPPTLPTLNLAELEKRAIEEALRQVNGNRTHAARILGIGLRTLRNKLNEPRRQTPVDSALAQSSQSIEAA